MKKRESFLTAAFILALVLGLTAAGCGGAQVKEDTSPSDVVKLYYEAIKKGDTKTMCELEGGSSSDCKRRSTNSSDMKYMVSKFPGRFDITDMEERIRGDKAAVTITSKDGKTSVMDLIRKDGKWVIASPITSEWRW